MAKNSGMSERRTHWEQVYEKKPPSTVSWFQPEPTLSLQLIENSGVARTDAIIDVGGGASTLVDCLQARGYENLSVLDIAAGALELAKERLGDAAEKVRWHASDVTSFVPPQTYDLWHDRAVFHFLTNPSDREKYVDVLKRAVPKGGHVIIATFAIGGPKKCSGLDVEQYDAPKLLETLGAEFRLLEEACETHITPAKAKQTFSYFRLMRL